MGSANTTLMTPRRRGCLTSHRRQPTRSEEHTSELQSPCNLVCRLLLEKKKKKKKKVIINNECKHGVEQDKKRILAEVYSEPVVTQRQRCSWRDEYCRMRRRTRAARAN